MSGQSQVKCHDEVFSSFGLLGRLDGLQRGETHPKCWINVLKVNCIPSTYLCPSCISTKGIFTKDQGQVQVIKCQHKIKVINMPCEASFLGHFHADIDGDRHVTLKYFRVTYIRVPKISTPKAGSIVTSYQTGNITRI